MSEALTVYRRESFTITEGHVVAVVIVMFLSLVNCLGVREGKWVQNIFTVAKTLGLLTLIIVGLTVAASAQAINANTNDLWQGITQTTQFAKVRQLAGLGTAVIALMVVGGAMVGSLFSADAWNNITFTATEVRNPRRNLPLCLALGTGVVITLYLLANLAYVAALPVQGNEAAARALEAEGKYSEAVLARGIDHAKDDRVASAVFARVSPHFGVIFISLAVMISTFGSINGMILMGARLYYAMARDGLFFQSVGQLNRRGVPAAGLILQGVWSALLVFSGTYSDLLDYVIFAALLFYVLTVVGLFLLRFKLPAAERPYKVIGYPLMPAVYVCLCLAIMLNLLVVKPVYTWPGLIIVLSGIPIYFLWRVIVRPTKAA
jgi:APA family basic amino acid/polyamine antiporter